MAQRRSIFKEILINFINSFRVKKYWGELKGKDYLGTEYYEVPGHLKQGSKRPSRWFSPANANNFDQEIPPEWDAWLKYRRQDPPTQEEIQLNIQKMKNTIQNAQKLEMKNKKTFNDTITMNTKGNFPQYESYKSSPD